MGLIAIQQITDIPEVKETIVMLRQLSKVIIVGQGQE